CRLLFFLLSPSASLPASNRSAPTHTGTLAARAISTGSSPKRLASVPTTSSTPTPSRPYPRDKTSTSHPRSLSNLAKAITTGVLPAPPADKLPTLMTGQRSAFTFNSPAARRASFAASPAAYKGTSGQPHHR